MWKLG
ncbi:hypothetical protein Taro_050431 [Colocasia esculenta]